MSEPSYRHSIKRRFAVLFSPLRLVLWIAALCWCAVLNLALYIPDPEGMAWAGPVSIVPVYALLAWTLVTDARHRRAERQADRARLDWGPRLGRGTELHHLKPGRRIRADGPGKRARESLRRPRERLAILLAVHL
ncbi:hypothetical protein [Tessaracoccus aquimaris]|uniref:hypothetical protein n=1 Tax=Tessaracoccus aquimaris TaxID=1332264 RepID=UPI0011AB6CF1|nr:hypothetical protein [Tessaracoccus aquimaris]